MGDDLNERRGDVTVVSRHMISYPLAETTEQYAHRTEMAMKHGIAIERRMVSFVVEVVKPLFPTAQTRHNPRSKRK